jgi:DNA replication protein DnaC
MGWQAAVVGAIGAATFKQQGKIGKFNEAVGNRNAKVLEAEAEQIGKKTEFDIARFNESYQKLVGQAEVAFAKSGVVSGTGTAYRIAAANAREKYMQENIIRYNSQVAQSKKIEQANFAKINAQMAREQARMAQFQTVASTGTSLLNMGSFGTSSPQGQFGSTSNNLNFSNYS